MAEPIKDVTIVGGGSSGWLAGAMLSWLFEGAIAQKRMRVRLIESPRIGIIGVGEATSPSMARTLAELGVTETEFIARSNASFKIGGWFVDWNRDQAGRPVSWVNPFTVLQNVNKVSAGYYFGAFGGAREELQGDAYARAVSPCPKLIDAGRGPRAKGAADYAADLTYAYHTDAKVFAEMLKEVGLRRGVEHVLDEVVDVELDERGFVAALNLQAHGRQPVELVIDCTGFRGEIIQKALGEPFEPYDKYLLNDRACVLQIPYTNEKSAIEPATRATALPAGWSFHVPLFNRLGTGYIYSSKFRSDDEAVGEFLEYLGPKAAGIEPRILPMRIGKTRRSWVKNCIALGLASGFVEPLEGTAIYMTDMSLRWLYTYFPDAEFNPSLSGRYNDTVNGFYDEVIDFIALHFRLNNRDEPYWRTAREEIPIPDSLAENLELWRWSLPAQWDLKSTVFFNETNYQAALFGKGYYNSASPTRPGLREDIWRAHNMQTERAFDQIVHNLPDHVDLLKSIREANGLR